MHIPSSMLHGAICPVTLTVATCGVAAAGYLAFHQDKKPTVGAFGAVTALIFSAQMLNFPIAHATSGHVLGGVLAASLLGIPFALLSITLVLAVQALFFADGGMMAIGANVISMAFVGAGLGGYLVNALRTQGLGKWWSLAIASWVSLVLAATVCAIQVAIGANITFSSILTPMIMTHAVIGLAEALATVAVVAAVEHLSVVPVSLALAGVMVLVTPWASVLPETLEHFSNGAVSTNTSVFAALAGALIVYGAALATGKLIKGGALCKRSI